MLSLGRKTHDMDVYKFFYYRPHQETNDFWFQSDFILKPRAFNESPRRREMQNRTSKPKQRAYVLASSFRRAPLRLHCNRFAHCGHHHHHRRRRKATYHLRGTTEGYEYVMKYSENHCEPWVRVCAYAWDFKDLAPLWQFCLSFAGVLLERETKEYLHWLVAFGKHFGPILRQTHKR